MVLLPDTKLPSDLKYMQHHGFGNRDFKVEDVLLDATGTVKVCDLGFVKRVKKKEEVVVS